MKFIEQKISGVFEIVLNPIQDERGFFMRVFDQKLFENIRHYHPWVQENHSLSIDKHTLRGLHFQLPPFTEAKLVRAIRGSIIDVFVDLREGSETFGHWGSIELSSAIRNLAYIPRGLAHGYVTLEQNTEIIYKVDNFYNPESERGIIWDDTQLKINWQIDDPKLSEKDRNQPSFESFVRNVKSINLL